MPVSRVSAPIVRLIGEPTESTTPGGPPPAPATRPPQPAARNSRSQSRSQSAASSRGAHGHRGAEQGHQDQCQDVRKLHGHGVPVHMRQSIEPGSKRRALVRHPGKQQACRSGLVVGDSKDGQTQMKERDGEQEAHRRDQEASPAFQGKEQAET